MALPPPPPPPPPPAAARRGSLAHALSLESLGAAPAGLRSPARVGLASRDAATMPPPSPPPPPPLSLRRDSLPPLAGDGSRVPVLQLASPASSSDPAAAAAGEELPALLYRPHALTLAFSNAEAEGDYRRWRAQLAHSRRVWLLAALVLLAHRALVAPLALGQPVAWHWALAYAAAAAWLLLWARCEPAAEGCGAAQPAWAVAPASLLCLAAAADVAAHAPAALPYALAACELLLLLATPSLFVATAVAAAALPCALAPAWLLGDAAWAAAYASAAALALGALHAYHAERSDRERFMSLELLAHTREHAQAPANSKRAFLAMVTHELRTPLNVVVGSTDLLLDGRMARREQLSCLADVRAAADQLNEKLSDVLLLSECSGGHCESRAAPFGLPRLLDRALRHARARCGDARDAGRLRCELPASLPVRLRGDAAHLRVVLRHLLSNALKFSQRAADAAVVIRVAVRAAPPLPSASSSTSASAASSRAASEDEACEDAPSQPLLLPQPAHARALAPASAATLEVCVCDRGVGVSAATEARLFRLFEQGDAGFARAYEGLGIGLSLSAALARLMGGRLGFQRPADGVGSIFALSVPVQLAPTAQPAPLRRVVVAPSDAAPRPLPLALLRAPEDACYADHLAVAAHALSPDARVAQFGSFDALRAAAEDAVAAARGAPLLVLVACEFGDEPLAVLRELLRSLGARDAAVLRARLPGRGAAASEEEAAAAAAAAAAAGARRALSASLAPASARRAFSFSPVSAGAPRGARCLAAAECPSLCEPAARLRSDAGAEAGGGEGGGGGGGGEEDADEEGEEEEGEEEDGDIYANSPEASPRLRRDPVVLLPASARSLQRAAAAAMRRARAPAAAAAGDGAGAGAGAGEAATPLRVLVVEDNAVNRKVVCKMVERAGHAAATAENGAECLRYLATLRARDECDLVLMDLHMPVMDGLEAARRIRADRASPFADVHIAALTAAVTTETRQLCRESGMQDFFGKPFERAALEALFSRLARAKLEDRWRRAAKAPPPPTPPLQLQPAPFARRRPPPLSPISRPSSATCGGSGSGAACASGGGGQGLGGAAPLL